MDLDIIIFAWTDWD